MNLEIQECNILYLFFIIYSKNHIGLGVKNKFIFQKKKKGQIKLYLNWLLSGLYMSKNDLTT